MKLGELLDVMASKDGDELFEKVSEILGKIGIATTYSNGDVKDLYRLCCEVAEVRNKGK